MLRQLCETVRWIEGHTTGNQSALSRLRHRDFLDPAKVLMSRHGQQAPASSNLDQTPPDYLALGIIHSSGCAGGVSSLFTDPGSD